MSYRSPERDFDPGESFDRLVSYIERFQLSYNLESHGVEPYRIFKSFVSDHRESRAWIGGGKGYGQQGMTSALAEALQHHLSFTTISHYDREQLPLLPVSTILSSPVLAKYAKYGRLFEHCNDTEVFALPFTNIHDDSASPECIYYPVALTEPRYQKLQNAKPVSADGLSWRSHDTGSALGLTYDECLLHGMTEWIEKHSLSEFLVRNFFGPDSGRKVISYLDKSTLPADLRELVQHIERQFDDELSIIALVNEFNIPCVLTLFTRQRDCVAQPKGLACSLHREYAVEKSLFEALQCRLLYTPAANARELTIAANFNKYPLFFSAYTFAISDIPADSVGYPELPLCADIALADQIATISDRLMDAGGYQVYRHIYDSGDGGLTSMHVFVPGLNETFLVKEGKFVVERNCKGI